MRRGDGAEFSAKAFSDPGGDKRFSAAILAVFAIGAANRSGMGVPSQIASAPSG